MVDEIDGIGRELVESSTIHSIGYHPERSILAVGFKSGAIFHYSTVPSDVALDFYNAGSKGQFYAAYIKGKYPSQKMTGPCRSCGVVGVIGEVCDDPGCADRGVAKHYLVDKTHGEPPAEATA